MPLVLTLIVSSQSDIFAAAAAAGALKHTIISGCCLFTNLSALFSWLSLFSFFSAKRKKKTHWKNTQQISFILLFSNIRFVLIVWTSFDWSIFRLKCVFLHKRTKHNRHTGKKKHIYTYTFHEVKQKGQLPAGLIFMINMLATTVRFV